MHIGMRLLHLAAADLSVSISRQQVHHIFSFSLRSWSVTSFCFWHLLTSEFNELSTLFRRISCWWYGTTAVVVLPVSSGLHTSGCTTFCLCCRWPSPQCLRLDLVLVLAADRWGLLQSVARVIWGLQWWQTLKGPSLLLHSATSWAANGTCWALCMECTSSILGAPPDNRMSRREDPRRCTIGVVLSFLQERLERMLSPSTLKVYVAAIMAHHDAVDGRYLGSMISSWVSWRGPGGWIPPGHPLCPLGTSLSSWLDFRGVPLSRWTQSSWISCLLRQRSWPRSLPSNGSGTSRRFRLSKECLMFGPVYSHVVLRPRPGYVPKVPTRPMPNK